MRRRNWTSSRVLAVAVACGMATLPALAGMSVTGPFEDDTTQGDWRGTYGSCFYLIPDPRVEQNVDPVGPGLRSENPGSYRYNNCFGGPLFDNDPQVSNIDWRIFHNGENGQANAYHAKSHRAPASLWNPCLQDFWHATWSNGAMDTDPLAVDLVVSRDGDFTLSYYFTNADHACREMDFVLSIDDVEVGSGTIGDIADGKYISFDIRDFKALPGGSTISFAVNDAPGDPQCVPSEMRPMVDGLNSHISGVFIDSHACRTPDLDVPFGFRFPTPWSWGDGQIHGDDEDDEDEEDEEDEDGWGFWHRKDTKKKRHEERTSNKTTFGS